MLELILFIVIISVLLIGIYKIGERIDKNKKPTKFYWSSVIVLGIIIYFVIEKLQGNL